MQKEQLRHDIVFKSGNKRLECYDEILLVVKEMTKQLDAYLAIQIQKLIAKDLGKQKALDHNKKSNITNSFYCKYDNICHYCSKKKKLFCILHKEL